MRILVADDDPDTCLLVTAVLEKEGHTCLVARDAMQVMHVAVHQRPDLVVLDISMPAGTGIGALERMKRSARTENVPVIILSGARDQAIIDRVLALGALEFVPKPFDADALLAAIARVQGADTSSPG